MSNYVNVIVIMHNYNYEIVIVFFILMFLVVILKVVQYDLLGRVKKLRLKFRINSS